MKGDRKKCLEPAASDYLDKPVNTKQLLAVLRMWLHREEVDNEPERPLFDRTNEANCAISKQLPARNRVSSSAAEEG
jgi:DNA-binding response OmpR family regulator